MPGVWALTDTTPLLLVYIIAVIILVLLIIFNNFLVKFIAGTQQLPLISQENVILVTKKYFSAIIDFLVIFWSSCRVDFNAGSFSTTITSA